MVVEDIQPTRAANAFRTKFLPQIMSDLHFCGLDPESKTPCFPTIQPLLHSVHCELHICVFQRNAEPAVEPSVQESTLPKGALDLTSCISLNESL